MDPELHHTMDQDAIVFNENDLLEVHGLTQGAILNGNKVSQRGIRNAMKRVIFGCPAFVTSA